MIDYDQIANQVRGIEPVDDDQGQTQQEMELIATAKKRWQRAVEAERENREAALDDVKFLTGDQWDEQMRQKRKRQYRPCLTMNMLPKFIHNVTGDARQNKPSIEVHPVDSDADPVTAQVLEGLIRNIEYVSNSAAARDNALDQAVKSGFGYYRIGTRYSDDDTFEQDIYVQRITDNRSVAFDPTTIEPDRSDARWCFVTERISKDEYKSRFPGKEPSSFETGDTETDQTEDDILIAEYWLKEPFKKTLCLVELLDVMGNPTGVTETIEKIYNEAPPGTRIVKERQVDSLRLMRRIIDGDKVLEENKWAGKYIPVIEVAGEETFVDGKRHLASVIRYSKDPQRIFNYSWTSAIEQVALQPKAPYIGTASMFEGHPEWDQANQEIFSKLEFENDPMRPGDRPQRSEPPALSQGYVQLLGFSSQGLKDTSGIYDASLGAKSNETSGIAIQARQHEGDIATFLWIDNLTLAITYEGKVLVDLIPKIYDSERIVRVRGKDGTSQFAAVNTIKRDETGQPLLDEQGRPIPLNDLTLGKYDVVVSVGPTYRTQREKAADAMVKLVQAFPPIAPIVVPKIAKSLDWEGAEEIAQQMQPVQQPPQAGPPGIPGGGAPGSPPGMAPGLPPEQMPMP